jgi:hypothetical protein
MNERDPLAETLAALVAVPLDPPFAAKVGARAKAELRGPPRAAFEMASVRAAAARGLVPALLALAAVVGTADAASTVVKIYGSGPAASSQ